MIRLLLVLAALAITAAFGVILFGAAGRMDLPFVWAYLAILGGLGVVAMVFIDLGLLKERLKPAPGGLDARVIVPLKILGWAGLIFAALDIGRLNISDTVPLLVQVIAMAGVGAGLWVAIWAMLVNRFFSPVVRLQDERGHHLITTGPYRFVRHPGYTGTVVSVLCIGPALGSWLATIPLVIFALLILRRARLEDRFLHDKLEGYPAYARRVRYRLLPGVW
ncbi:MAG: methyltransferase family protein [Planctomycetota bacterium]